MATKKTLKPSVLKLSAYTIAANCTSLEDIDIGIKELRDYFDLCYTQKKRPKPLAHKRFANLYAKRDNIMKSYEKTTTNKR